MGRNLSAETRGIGLAFMLLWCEFMSHGQKSVLYKWDLSQHK